MPGMIPINQYDSGLEGEGGIGGLVIQAAT